MNRIDFLKSTIKEAQEAINSANAEIERHAIYPKDDFAPGAVIQFDLIFEKGGRVYSYAAIKIADLWYLTGRETSALSWDELIVLWSDGLVGLWYVTDFETLVEPGEFARGEATYAEGETLIRTRAMVDAEPVDYFDGRPYARGAIDPAQAERQNDSINGTEF